MKGYTIKIKVGKVAIENMVCDDWGEAFKIVSAFSIAKLDNSSLEIEEVEIECDT